MPYFSKDYIEHMDVEFNKVRKDLIVSRSSNNFLTRETPVFNGCDEEFDFWKRHSRFILELS